MAVMFNKIILWFSVFLLCSACTGGSNQFDSEVDFVSPEDISRDNEDEFYFSNNFRNLNGQAVYLHIINSFGQSVVLPPAQAGALQIANTVVEGFRMNSGCVKVLEGDFPITVSLCDSIECKAVRNIVDLHTPGHYNMSGVGGLVIPEVYPVSPCSEDLIQYINQAGEYSPL